MVQGKIYSYGDDLSEVFNIRRSVFVEELGYSENLLYDEGDELSNHVVVYEGVDDLIAVATGSLSFHDKQFQISNVAVIKQFRGKKYGDFVVRMLVNRALLSNGKEIYTLVSKASVKFFETLNFHREPIDIIGDSILMKLTINDLIPPCQKETMTALKR